MLYHTYNRLYHIGGQVENNLNAIVRLVSAFDRISGYQIAGDNRQFTVVQYVTDELMLFLAAYP